MFASSLASSSSSPPNLKNQILRLKVGGGQSVTSVLQSWLANGYTVTFSHLRYISQLLVNSNRYKPALEIFTWMETRYNSRNSASDNAMRLELIIKVHGITQAEHYFKLMPDSASRKAAFLPLLRAYVQQRDVVKAEAFMMNLNDSGFLVSPHPFNEMMKLYMSTSQLEKVGFVILQMKRNRIPLNILSYNLWMSSFCGMSLVTKVEMVYKEMMSDQNVDVGWSTLVTLANTYTKAGIVEKALWALKMAEKKLSTNYRLGYFFLITQYCSLRNKEGVQRVWESSKGVGERITCANYICILSCFVKLDDLVEAEKVFVDWESSCRNYDIRVSNVLLAAYVRKGLISRAESLHLRTLQRGGRPNFKTWEILLEGWVKSHEMDKAITAMNRIFCLLKHCDWRPSPGNLIAIAEHLEKQGSFGDANRYIRVVHHFGLASLPLYKIFLRMHLNAKRTAFDLLKMMEKDKVGMDDETSSLVEVLNSYA
ncbi:Tetratricopeptide repeat (TPR)-like superfamily protein [Euphorbia peplus]|nr:Tetratricopeptide repeat (TPR)-like superfamily protein [Euphorbia peplus]